MLLMRKECYRLTSRITHALPIPWVHRILHSTLPPCPGQACRRWQMLFHELYGKVFLRGRSSLTFLPATVAGLEFTRYCSQSRIYSQSLKSVACQMREASKKEIDIVQSIWHMKHPTTFIHTSRGFALLLGQDRWTCQESMMSLGHLGPTC